MPDGYWRNANDHVFTQSEHGPVDVLGYPILDGGINPETNLLAVKFSVSGRVHWGEIDMALQTPQKVAEAWTRGTINRIIIRDAKHIKGFTVSWIHHLQASKIERRAEGFGWHGDDFVYGDIRFTPTGRETAYRGSTANKVFSAKGELKPWQDTLVLVRGNIPLEIAVVSAFAAPLVKLVASNSAVLSIFSHESGRGKTTSLQIGQAVWGDPFIGMSSLEDTINAVGKKMEILRHLPIYWDELKTTEQVERIVNIIFQTTGSKSKARLRADASSAPVNAFTTLFAVASNHGVAGPVIRATSGSDAGGIRVFEIEADQPIGDAISIYDSNQLIKKLDDNHGVAGAIYAEYIVNNKPRCEAITKGIAAHLEQAFQFEKRERMWLNTMTTIVAGAMIAKECRLIDFDVDAIFAYLTRKFSGLRASRTAQSYSMLNMPAADWLAEMQRDLVGVNMVITDTVPRPVPGRRWSPLTNVGNFGVVDMNRLKHVWVQVGRNDDCWLISQKPFDQWVFDHGYSSEQVLALIRKDYNVAYHKATVGAGIAFLGDLKQTPCLYLSPKLKPKP
jgi:hypothetical protein